MNYKYNEEFYGELIFNNGFQSRFIKYELLVLVKYLKQIKEYSKKDTEKFIYDFCQKNIEGYNEIQYFKIIDSAIRNGRKKNNKLLVVKDVYVTNKELKYIDNLDIDNEYKKLLLSFLIHRKIAYQIHKLNDENAKLSAYFGGSRKKYREIFKTANIVGKYNIDGMIAELVKKNIILSIMQGDIVLEFMYSIYDYIEEPTKIRNWESRELKDGTKKILEYNLDERDINMEVTDFENIGYIFDYYKGEHRVKKCSKCDKLIKPKNNRQEYCDECWKDIRQEQNKEKSLKYYYKTKNFTI